MSLAQARDLEENGRGAGRQAALLVCPELVDAPPVEPDLDRLDLDPADLDRLDLVDVDLDLDLDCESIADAAIPPPGRAADDHLPAAIGARTPGGRPRADATTDALQLLLKDIGKLPLLTAREEIVLAKGIERGSAAAKQRLVASNLRLVVSISRNYRDQGLPLLDLIQEGTIGLVRAAEKFDHRRGFRFSTYASWLISQAISRALADKSRMIRMPVYLVEKLQKIRRVERELESRHGRDPTLAEIAAVTGIDVSAVEAIRQVAQPPVSLERPIDEEDGTELGDVIADPDRQAGCPYQRASQALTRKALWDVLKRLPDRERQVLVLRYGLFGEQPRTLEEIGRSFNLTRERIRQIENETIKKLERLDETQHLRLGA